MKKFISNLSIIIPVYNEKKQNKKYKKTNNCCG